MNSRTVARIPFDGNFRNANDIQGPQFEADLFSELARFVSPAFMTHYRPEANGMLERMHRTLKVTLKCSPETPCPQVLLAALLGLRMPWKEDLQASSVEIVFGTSL